jgi:hypothetical protein
MIVGGAREASKPGRHAAVDGATAGDAAERRRPWWVWVVPFVVTCAVLVARNAFLFRRSYYEASDMGANSILIEQARGFRLLVGDYSRLGFNHPGPAYLYVQAWGESLFYDALHVVPTPWNGQVLAVYVLNSALVALAVVVIYGWTRSVAGAAACLAAFAGFAAIHPMILSSDWMSYLYVVTYTLFVIAAASVAAGRGRQDAPIAVLAGWFLLHGHAAYLVFVPLLTVAALACALWPARRALLRSSPRSWGRAARDSVAAHRAAWGAVAVISAVFALPIVINLVLHWPGDFVQYFSYGSAAKSGSRSAGAVIRYVLWFWWPTATAPASRVVAGIPVLGYVIAAALAWWCGAGPVRRFLLVLLGLNLVSSVAFTAYTAVGVDKLTRNGHYIGYFYWSAPLITLLVVAVALAQGLAGTVAPRIAVPRIAVPRTAAKVVITVAAVAIAVAAVAVFAAVPLSRTSTVYSDPGAPWMSPPSTDAAIPGAVAALAARSGGKTLLLGNDHDAWEDLTGFLVQAERTGVRACVTDPARSFLVSSQFICTPAQLASGARYYLHSTEVPEHGTVLARMDVAWVTAGGR